MEAVRQVALTNPMTNSLSCRPWPIIPRMVEKNAHETGLSNRPNFKDHPTIGDIVSNKYFFRWSSNGQQGSTRDIYKKNMWNIMNSPVTRWGFNPVPFSLAKWHRNPSASQSFVKAVEPPWRRELGSKNFPIRLEHKTQCISYCGKCWNKKLNSNWPSALDSNRTFGGTFRDSMRFLRPKSSTD